MPPLLRPSRPLLFPRSNITEFVARVTPVDDQLPYRYPDISLSMTVDEFKVTEFHRGNLRYTDDDTDDRQIRLVDTGAYLGENWGRFIPN